ncbi:hypothetical protein GCM10010329_85030 [Streptomyces spiroverticillatus]|uniref:Uncharacterized protein n=1 Tax=Streptomyces finlayi TaxID=67296 RepID=A0A918X983_9ACTN|nr:hypothetical protein [Streptomyces finlayi]GHA49842.1 hypothetical protein GCM10010329_85030 [Streptomyces spiroverticillatus]GHD19586.1 hypothetical protein GCM10010334_83400 [Streptomyces finlayi]
MPTAVRTIKRGGSRFYVDPVNAEKLPGVTSVVGMLPKPFLVYWAARLTAETAVQNLDAVRSIAERDAEGAVDYLRHAHSRYTKLRAGIGSDAHDLFERMIRGEAIGRVHPDLEPYRAGFAEFLDAVRPELVSAEDIAWSDEHQYAGSFDAILRVRLSEDGTPDHENGEWHTLIVDWKTSKSAYPDVALQMSAYANADRMISPDGTSEPMPELDGAAVLHITPEGWTFKPVRVDREVFDVFLTLRRIFEWDRGLSKTVFGRAIAKSVGRLVTGTQRRA